MSLCGLCDGLRGVPPLSRVYKPTSVTDRGHRVPEPTSPAQIASFLGMTVYYLSFLPQYLDTTAPLRKLKMQLTSPPILAHFDLASPTFVTWDASTIAVGGMMSQLQSDVEKPIAFASRALSPTEQRYSVGE